jgi:hypothetical protein
VSDLALLYPPREEKTMRHRLMNREASEQQIPIACKKGMQMKGDVRSLTKEKLGRRVLHTVAILAMLSVGAIGTLQAGPPPHPILTFSIPDPVGDESGAIDVTGMQMTFDQKTGDYTIDLTADAAHPFSSQFRVNINVFNADAPPKYSLFQDVCRQCDTFDIKANSGNDFDLPTSSLTLRLIGTSRTLKYWNPDNRVATTTWAGLGNPPGASLFRSSVLNLPLTSPPLTNEDVIGYNDQTGDGSSGVAIIAVSP